MTERMLRRRAAQVVTAAVAVVALVATGYGATALAQTEVDAPTTTAPQAAPDGPTSTTTPATTAPTTAAPTTTLAPTTVPAARPAPTTTVPSGLTEISVPRASAGTATLSLTKSTTLATPRPGEAFEYRLVGSCSSLVEDCVNFTVTDTLPAELEVTSLPQSNTLREVTYDPATRLLTVRYKVPIAAGATGLPAGSSQSFGIGVRLPVETPVLDGDVISNTGTVDADNGDPVDSSVDVTAVVPTAPAAAATKSWSPASGLALTSPDSTVTVTGRNSSSTSTQVKEVAVEDSTVAVWDRFDLTSAGILEAYPPGADQVFVDLCLLPVADAPCAEGDWTTVGPQSGTAPFTLSDGGNTLADAVGVRYRFSSSSGADLPFSADGGRVAFGLELRDTLRSTGAELNPSTSQRIDNCATPRVVEASSTETFGTDACDRYTILPGSSVVGASKKMFSDGDGNWAADGHIVVGQNSGVTMAITATNRSAFPVPLMQIAEPSPSALNEFSKIDATKARINFPAGATQATVSVDCRSGADPADVVLTAPPTSVTLTDLGCDPDVFPGSVVVVFSGADGSGAGLIAPSAAGSLELHGTAARVDTSDVSSGLTNCAETKVSSNPDGTGSSTADACATAQVQNPRPDIGNGVKTTTGVSSIVPGQDLDFALSFKNTGNIPVSNIVLVDPPDPAASTNPFNLVQLTALRATTASPPSTLEVYDPNVAAYVPYVASDAALLARAKGIRLTVTGNLPVGATFRVGYSVKVRSSVPVGASFRNCAQIGIDRPDPAKQFCNTTAVGVANPTSGASINKVISPDRVFRPQPGLPAQVVQVKHQAQNTGTLYLKRMVLTDADVDFFDATIFKGNIKVNFPHGANRVQVDVCTTGCGSSIWITGSRTSSSSPGIPGGVTAADVKGIRFTFTNSNNGYEILPSPNFPTTGSCTNATVCFDAEVRQFLASDGTTPVPDQLVDTTDGAGESELQTPGTTFSIPPVSATLDVVQGTAQLQLDKGPDSRIGPGDVAPFSLVTTNTGTDAVVDPVVVDPLPAGLTFEPVIAGAPAGQPYLLSYVLPAGYPTPPTVTYTAVKGGDAGAPPGCTDPNRVCKLSWSFPGWTLPPGGKIQATFNVKLSPGVVAGQVVTNSAGASGANEGLTCKNATSVTDGAAYGTGLYCTDTANVTTLAGDDFQVSKWVRADAALGFLNPAGAVVPVTSSECPQFFANGGVYTRFPCTARTLPGQAIEYLVLGVNSGTNPASQVVLTDGLPVQGDTGVLLSNQPRGTQWNNRPTMLTPVVNAEGYPATTGYTNSTFPGSSFCTTSLQPPPAVCPPSAFGAGFGPGNTGFQTVLNFPDSDLLPPGGSFTLTWSMQAPASLTSALSEPIAWNSVAYRPTFKLPGGGTSTLPATEPIKVGVGMPLGAFGVSKQVVGLPNGVPVNPFEFAYSCTVESASLGTTEVASGTFTLEDGDVFGSGQVPQGADCAVWETNSQGGDSDHIGQDNAQHVVIDPVAGIQVLPFVNSYETGSLTLSKSVVWDAVPPVELPGPFEFDVSCSFPTPDRLLPGFPQTFSLGDTGSASITGIPKGTQCLVVETETQGSMVTSWTVTEGTTELGQDGTAVGATVESLAAGGTTVEATNRYTTGAVKIVKQLDGPASMWAQGPFTFDMTCTDSGGVLPDVTRTVTLDAAHLEQVVSPVPSGFDCSVVETTRGDAASQTVTPATAQRIPDYTTDPPGPVVFTAVNDYPSGSVTVAKQLAGGAASLMAGASFTLRVQCERDIVGGAGSQVVVDRSVTLKGGESTTLPDVVPIGARCWAEETRTVGATSVAITNDVNNKATITDASPDLTITATNTFSPGGNRNNLQDQSGIKVVKSLAGPGAAAATGPFTFSTVCTLDGFTLPDYPVLTLTPTNLVGYVNPVPAGAECTVTETGQGNATGVVPRTVATVTVPATDAPAVQADVVNRFDNAPTTTVPSNGGNSGGSNGDGSLARTGGSVARPLGASVVLLLAGAGLLAWRRRREDD